MGGSFKHCNSRLKFSMPEGDFVFFVNLADLPFLGVLLFLGLFQARKVFGFWGLFSCFLSVFLGIYFWGSEG